MLEKYDVSRLRNVAAAATALGIDLVPILEASEVVPNRDNEMYPGKRTLDSYYALITKNSKEGLNEDEEVLLRNIEENIALTIIDCLRNNGLTQVRETEAEPVT